MCKKQARFTDVRELPIFNKRGRGKLDMKAEYFLAKFEGSPAIRPAEVVWLKVLLETAYEIGKTDAELVE